MSNTNSNSYYKFVGEGQQGRVLQISPYRCIKVYKESKYAKRETSAYKKAKGSTIIPKIYESGANYIIMEYIHGLTLKEYIRKHGQITESFAQQIISLIKEMKRIGFTRVDAALRHIFVTNNNELKVIDLTNSYTHKSSSPRMILDGLDKMGHKETFLKYVKQLEPDLYKEWKHHS